ncbi:MAG: TorF family putative porin [Brevundimonas sp.]|uniref:TorF family putative porin n=1 Tax=Brevundimonas sp. TaxID=1871086 RepID=UPI00391CBD72
MSIIRALICAAPLLALALPATALAQPAGGQWSGAIEIASDNRSKGVSKSNGQPFVSGLIEWESASGSWFIQGEVETVDRGAGGDIEIGTMIGIRPQIAGFDMTFAIEHEQMLRGLPGGRDSQWQVIARARRGIGPATATVRLEHTPRSITNGGHSTWAEAEVGWAVSPRTEVSAAIGRREQELGADYTAWNAGVTFALTRTIDLDVRYYDNSERDLGRAYERRLVAGFAVFF